MWKTIFSDESERVPGPDMRHGNTILYSNPDWLWVRVANVAGKHIRVTVEEEVSECCEKWRGHRSCEYGTGAQQAVFKFCPECGGKL